HCLDSFNDALQAVSGRLLPIRFVGPNDPDRPRPGQEGMHTASLPGAEVLGGARAKPAAGPGTDAGRDTHPMVPSDHATTPGRAARDETDQRETGQNASAASPPGGCPPASTIEARPIETDRSSNARQAANDPNHNRSTPAPASTTTGATHTTTTATPGTTPGQAGAAHGAGVALGAVGARPAVATQRPATRDDALVINPDYTFESFVVGPSNRLAHAAALAVAANPGTAYNPLFTHGGVGLGKTHLMQAVSLRIHEANPDLIIYYLSCESFMTQFMEAVQAGKMTDFRHRFRDVDVLIVDDIHFLAKGDTSQEEFFHTFNTLHHANKQIVLSSDAPPEEIPELEDRLVSRFKWGLVASIDPPRLETRVEILRSKARIRGIHLESDVAEFVAERVATNIRELEGALTQLQMRAAVETRPIDLRLAREALGSRPGGPRPSAPTLERIIEAITDFYGVRLADLQSKRRHRSITQPRQVCMFLARKLTRHSLEEIGGYFGGRDHTTVMHALRAVEQRKSDDPEFARTLESLEHRIQTS
ncbi:MAG: chromosomal replication initiator protein DnaA, partial [Planctomycetota bacterium]